jgi:hypothetical protein
VADPDPLGRLSQIINIEMGIVERVVGKGFAVGDLGLGRVNTDCSANNVHHLALLLPTHSPEVHCSLGPF